MKSTLKIFITENCPGCDEARSIANRIEQECSELAVELIDITDSQAIVPEAVFATPTFMLDDQIVSLGNPSPKQVDQWLEEAVVQPSIE